MASADTKIVLTAEDRTRQAFESAKRNFEGLTGSVSRVSALMAGLGVGLSAAGLTAFVKSSIDAADEIGKMAQRVGVGTEALSALKYAADLSDVSLESLGNGLKKLAVNAADTAKGTGEARDAFAALGINVKTSSGSLKGADELLAEIAAQFAGFEDGAAKTALAVKLFGKAGADLIPLLNAGASGLADMRAEAERLGVVISPGQAKAAELFNDQLTVMQARAKGVGIAIANELLPGLNGVLERWERAAQLSQQGYGFFDLMFGVGVNPTGKTDDQLRDVVEKIDLLKQQREASTGGLFGGSSKAFDDEIAKLEKLRDLLESFQLVSVGGNKYTGNLDFIREQQAAIDELGKAGTPELFDSAAAEKNQAALRKAFDTKVLDDFLAKLRTNFRAIDAEYRKLVDDLTGPDLSNAKGFDVSAQLSKGRAALAGGDVVGVEAAAARGKELLRGLKDNGGITDEFTYYARQLEQLERDANLRQQASVKDAIKMANEEAQYQMAQAEKLKFQVDVDAIRSQFREGVDMIKRDLEDGTIPIPVVIVPEGRGEISGGGRSVSFTTAATKFGR